MARQANVRLPGPEANALSDSPPLWPVFPGAADARWRLQTGCKLVVIVNVDDGLFEHSERSMGVKFDAVTISPRSEWMSKESIGSRWVRACTSALSGRS